MFDPVLSLLNAHPLFASFWGAFFFGDSVLLTLAYLAGEMYWPVWPILTMTFVGTAAADTAWFIAGRFFGEAVGRSGFMQRERKKVAKLLDLLIGKNPAFALIAIKFLYGSRVAMIVYVAARGMRFGSFFLYNSLGIVAWLAVFFPLGFAAGRGVSYILPSAYTVQAVIAVLIVSAIGMRIFTVWVTKKVTN